MYNKLLLELRILTSDYYCNQPIIAGGYEIKVIPAKKSRTLLSALPERTVIAPKGRTIKEVRNYMLPSLAGKSLPVGEPLLFMTFAHLNETPEAIVDFANRFGLLGLQGADPYTEEDIEDWYSEIRKMRQHIEMVEVGSYREQDWPQAAFNVDGSVFNGSSIRLLRTGKNNGLELKVSISTLQQALWVLLGQWISNTGMDKRKCPLCDHWFTSGNPGGFRKSKLYCRDSCANTAQQPHGKRKLKAKAKEKQK